jgi:hypothetical protein
VIKLSVPRPEVSRTHPTNTRGEGDGLMLRFEQAVAFIKAFDTAVLAA